MATERQIYERGIDKHVYYGVCSTSASTAEKVVVVKNPTLVTETSSITVGEGNEAYETTETKYYLDLNDGDQLIVAFANRNDSESVTLSLQIDDSREDIEAEVDSGRVVINGSSNISVKDYWEAGENVTFTYSIDNNNAYWKINNCGVATNNRYGRVKISGTIPVTTDISSTALTYPAILDLIDSSSSTGLIGWEAATGSSKEIGKITYTVTDTEGTSTSEIPITTFSNLSDFINTGQDNSDHYFVMRVENTIDETNHTLNIGTVNADTLTGSLHGSNLADDSVSGDKIISLPFSKVTGFSLPAHTHPANQLTGLPSHTHSASEITSGTFATSQIPSLDASKITGTKTSSFISDFNNQVKVVVKTLFTTRTVSGYVYVDKDSNMTQVANTTVLDGAAAAHVSCVYDGYIPLGIVGADLQVYGSRTAPSIPVFQDFYLGSNAVYFHVQTAGKTAGWIKANFRVLYLKA